MKKIVIERTKTGYFTCLNELFEVMNGKQENYNWLISDYDCNDYPALEIPIDKSYVWIDGSRLTQIVNAHFIQFIWGVFSAFPKDIKLEKVLKYPLPFADGNAEIWKPEIKIQNPLAEVEIISWDSTMAIITAKSDEMIEMFTKEYNNVE